MGATARAGVAVEFRATGVESVRNGLRLVRSESDNVGRATESMGHSSARSIGEFARGLGNLATQGRVTTLSMRELTGSLFGMSEILGPAGILIPILASVGFAIYEVFSRTRDEIEKTRIKAEQELANLQRSANLSGLSDLAQKYYSGDKYAVQGEYDPKESDAAFRARQLGVRGIEQEIATKQRLIAMNKTMIEQLRGDVRLSADESSQSIDRLIDANNRYAKSIADLTPYLPGFRKLAAGANAAFAEAAKDEGERTKNIVAEQQRQFLEGMKTKDLQPTLNNQFANDLFGVLLKTPKVHLMGEIVVKDLLDGMILGAQKQLAHLNPKLPVDTFAEKFLANIESMSERIRSGIVDTLGGAIDSGFEAAFAHGGNLGTVFSSITRSILAGLGSIFEEVGRNALIGLIGMAKIKEALLKFLPELGIPAALGLIAFGAILKGAASQVGTGGVSGGAGAGYGGGAYGGSLPGTTRTGVVTAASSSVAAASRLTPVVPQQNTFYVIGPDDPRAGRQIQQLLDNNAKRG